MSTNCLNVEYVVTKCFLVTNRLRVRVWLYLPVIYAIRELLQMRCMSIPQQVLQNLQIDDCQFGNSLDAYALQFRKRGRTNTPQRFNVEAVYKFLFLATLYLHDSPPRSHTQVIRNRLCCL